MHSIKKWRKIGIAANTEGRPADAIAAWQEMMKVQQQLREARGISDEVRYLRAEWWTNGIGHLGLLDFFAKRKLLGLHSSRYVIALRDGYVANHVYLDLWGKYFEFTREPPSEMELREDWPMVLELGGQWLPLEDAVWHVEHAWHEQGREPLLRLPREAVTRGREYLSRAGVGDRWFVTFHVRQTGLGAEDHLSVRNVIDVSTYAEAARLINEAGGAAVLMGRPPQIAPVSNMIDLTGAPDWLDVYLISQCRFFVGCNSGPSVAATTFGMPTLICNFAPRDAIFPFCNVTRLHKHLVNRFGDEVTVGNYGTEWNKRRLADAGILCQDNTASEIAAAVEQMLVAPISHPLDKVRLDAVATALHGGGCSQGVLLR